jgi:hypothetical protein
VAHGHDPANQKTAERGAPTVAELADRFMADHMRAKRKAGTVEFYRDILDRIVERAVGTTKADKVTLTPPVVVPLSVPGKPCLAPRTEAAASQPDSCTAASCLLFSLVRPASA